MQIIEHFANLTPVNIFINLLDVLLVWYVIYKILTLIKGTKAVQLLKGIFVIIIARLATDFWVRDVRLDVKTSHRVWFLGDYYHFPT